MIVKFSNGKIQEIRIADLDVFPSKGEIFFPENWGTDDIFGFLESKDDIKINFINPKDANSEFFLFDIKDKNYSHVNSINDSNPDSLFFLKNIMEIG